jgi:hypothetical protein
MSSALRGTSLCLGKIWALFYNCACDSMLLSKLIISGFSMNESKSYWINRNVLAFLSIAHVALQKSHFESYCLVKNYSVAKVLLLENFDATNISFEWIIRYSSIVVELISTQPLFFFAYIPLHSQKVTISYNTFLLFMYVFLAIAEYFCMHQFKSFLENIFRIKELALIRSIAFSIPEPINC